MLLHPINSVSADHGGVLDLRPCAKNERKPQMKNILMRLWKEEEAQDLMEYGLLLVLIVLIGAAAISPLGNAIANLFNDAKGCAQTPSSCGT